MSRIETEAANVPSPTFQQPDARAEQRAEKADLSTKESSSKLSAESSSALSNVAEFRALQEKNIFKKSGVTEIANLTFFDSQDDSQTKAQDKAQDKSQDKSQDKAVDKAPAKSPDNVTLDEQGRVSKVSYPAEGKTREFGRDANGEINKLTTGTKDGKWNYVKENGEWQMLAANGTKTAAPGFEINKEGEFTRHLEKGEVQIQGLDGKIIKEHSNVIGGTTRLNESGQVEKVTRPDGSTLSANYQDGKLTSISQTKDGITTNFTRQIENAANAENAANTKDDQNVVWKTDDAQPRTVKNLELSKNGNLSFTSDSGTSKSGSDEGSNGEIKHIIRSNGGEIKEGPGIGKYQFDDEGRVTSIENADGKKTRTLTYTERNSEPNSVTIADKEKNETLKFVQTQDKSGYALTSAGGQQSTWPGKIKIQDDGTYSIKAADNSTNNKIWDSFYPDGTKQKESRGADGTLNVFSDKGELISSKNKNGRELKAEYDDKGLVRIEVKQNDKTTLFGRNTDDSYTSTLKSEVNSVNKLKVSENDISFVRNNGDKVKVNNDGSVRSDKRDGSFVENNSSGKVTRVGLDDANYRTYSYTDSSNGSQLSAVKEITKAGGEKTWQANNPDGREFSMVSADGFLTYQKKGNTIVEDTNLGKIELRVDLQPGKLTMPNGSTRTFEYDSNNKLEKISDLKMTASGEKRQEWQRVSENADGTNKFESKAADGKVSERYNVANDGSGNVIYKTKPATNETGSANEIKLDGKERIARAADLLRANDRSDSIEEAREQLHELASSSGIKTDRLNDYMDKFEKRSREAAAEGMKAPTDEQIAKTYDNLSDLLKGKAGKDNGKEYFNAQERAQLCEQAMHNISSPKRINQGQNPTCNITTGEVFAASRHPEKYADTLKQVAVDGKLFTTSGKEVVLDREAYTASPDEKKFDPEGAYKGNRRNWASHILENAGINAFTQFAPKGPATWGYRYMGRDGNGNGVNPIMGGPEIQKAVKELWGGDMPYIAHNVAPSAEQLWAYKKDGNFPVGIPTLYAYNHSGQLSEQHVQTIHDVREVNGQTQVFLDDQNAGDVGWQSLSQLYGRQGLRGPAETPRGPRIIQKP